MNKETTQEVVYTEFIGEKGIKEVSNIEDDYVDITLEDSQTVKLKKSLFEIIKAEKRGVGNVTENINAALGREILEIMANYGLECDDISRVVNAAGNIAHNLREVKIGEMFSCNSSGSIKISKLLA